ncbi:phosphomannomutase/phosphoglucomutase [Methylophaga sp.]|uniref:phosphomannomutase/phosphoglucomutase n=1 Tax=Methylophaga sp. TaxID=2024840 RepID=UPI003F698E34
MKANDKLAIKLGATPVSLILLVVTVILLLGIVSTFSSSPEQNDNTPQQHAQTVQATVEKAIREKQNQLAAIASSPALAQVISSGSSQEIDRWQTQIRRLLPEVKQLCVLLQKVSSPTDSGCLPISFASLSSLRQLEQKPQSDLAILQLGSEQAHVLLAQKLEQATYPDATLLMAVNASWIDDLILDRLVSQSYVEITQGKKASTVLTQFGDPQYKTGAPVYSNPIANSHWQLQYWTSASATASATPLVLLVLLSVVVSIFWLLRDRWFNKLLRLDANTLDEQLMDLEQGQLKTSYLIAFSALSNVRDEVHRLVVPKRPAPSKPQSLHIEDVTPIEEPIPEPSEDAERIVEQALDSASHDIRFEEPPTPASKPEPEPELEPEPEPEPEPKKDEPPLEFNLEQVPSEEPLDLSPKNESPAPTQDGLPDKAIFRQYDIRGVVDKQLTKDVMHQLGMAVGSEALDQEQTKLVVGRDGRISSESLSDAFIAGVLSTGCDVIVLGEVPTPMVYFACEHLQTYTGAMITGSHNPVNFNGLKVVIAGKTLLGESVYALYERLKNKRLKKGQGRRSVQNIKEAYIERIKSDVQLARNMRVVVDCGNGVAGHVAGDVLRAIGCDVTELYCEVDGTFPNHHPDPGQPKNMQDLINVVKAQQAEIGLAFDGDGDRLGVVDTNGNIIWPDRLLLLMAQHLLAENPGASIIYDVKSTNLLEEGIKRAGGRPIMSPSGHSVIKKMMAEENALLAGEMTGHLFFKDRWYGFDDALYSAARLLELLAANKQDMTPTEIFAALPQRVSTPEIIIKMKEGESVKFIQQLQENVESLGGKISIVDGVRADYPGGWGLVRASNTVPGLTLRFEANTDEELEHIKQIFIQQMLQIKPTLSLLF